MEEKRTPDGRFSDDFLQKFYKLLSDVDRLIDHEKVDRKKYEEWYSDFSQQLVALGKLRLDLSNGRLTALESRPIIIQISEQRIKELFDERAEVHAGRAFIRLVLWVAGALGLVVTSALLAYFKFK